MGKQAGTTRNVSTTGPPSFARPFIESLLQRAEGQFQAGPPQFFPGSTVAPLSGLEEIAGDRTRAAVDDIGGRFAGSVNPALDFAVSGARDVRNNPFLEVAAEGAVRPVFQALTEQALPAIRQGAIAAGSGGSTRAGIAEGLATERATRAALDSTNALYSNAYGQGLSTMLQGLQLVPSLQQAQLAGPQALAGVGAQQRAVDQANINETVQRYLFNQAAPFQALQEYGNIVTRPFGGESFSSVEGTAPNSAQQILSLISVLGASAPGLIDLFNRIFSGRAPVAPNTGG